MNNELKKYIEKLKETRNILEKFTNRDEAIKYLIKETNLSEEECSIAYDFLMKIDLSKK